MFITMSAVSAENSTDIADVDSSLTTIEKDTSVVSNDIITKKTTDDVTKTNSSTNSKTASKITADSQSVNYNSTVKFTAKITNAVTGETVTGGKVVFKLNGKTMGYSAVTNGTAMYYFNTTTMTPKTYNLTVKYGETSTLLGSSAEAKLTILKSASKIVASNASVISGDTVKLSVQVTDINKSSQAKSGKVAFKINGKTVGYANVSDGVAYYSYVAHNSAKTYTITATYSGNNVYNSSRSETSYLTVNAIPTKASVTAVSSYSTDVELKATVVLKTDYSYLPSGTIVFKINGKTIGNATVSNGKASLIYDASNLTRGNYAVSALLKPTSFYAHSNATNNLTILAEKSFTYSQVKSAAVAVRTQFEANNIVSTVLVSKTRMGLQDFLALMIQTAKNVYRGNSKLNATYKHYKSISTQYDTVTPDTLTIKQIIDIGNTVYNYMEANNRPPTYVTTTIGKMGYYNLIYSYTKVLDVSASTYLPETCKIYSWAAIHPSNPKVRTIYITSDNIYNNNKDIAFMNSIKSKLESLGYKAVVGGLGPNSHNVAIWAQSLPDNAVQLSIFGGADAGVIYDVSTRSFMRTKANRLLFFAYNPSTSKDITGLSFLERAHDDNYSPSSFTGINNPDIYLTSHGYGYVYSYKVNEIVNSLIEYIS